MATRFELAPFDAEFPSSNYPALSTVNARPVLAYDASTAETAYWTRRAPTGLTGTLTATVHYFMASATTGKVDFEMQVEAVTPADAVDLDATTSFDTANTITAPTVPGTAGYLGSFTCTLTNADSIAAGDQVRFSLKRDATDATNDTAAGDCYVTGVLIDDAA